MRYLTTMLSCLLSLFGCHERSVSTSITRVAEQGADQLFSRTTVRPGERMFECVRSASGRCYYQVFNERCDAGDTHCERSDLQRFELRQGQQRYRRDLPVGYSSCVGSSPEKQCHRG